MPTRSLILFSLFLKDGEKRQREMGAYLFRFLSEDAVHKCPLMAEKQTLMGPDQYV